MSAVRFAVACVALFAGTFLAITWLLGTGPIFGISVTAMKPDSGVPTFEQAAARAQAESDYAKHTNQSDGDVRRDRLRLATLQAANAYAASPCDRVNKDRLVNAIIPYIRARMEIAGCRGVVCGSDRQIEDAAKAFGTPLDARVNEALSEALDIGGITDNDFPTDMRRWVMHLVYGKSPTPDCARPPPARNAPRAASSESPRQPRPAPTKVVGSEPWSASEERSETVRKIARRGALEALERPHASRCDAEGRKQFLSALSYYLYHRQVQFGVYAKWSDAGRRHVEQAWATAEDTRIQRLYREAVSGGYVTPADFEKSLREPAAEMAGTAKIAAKSCAA